MYIWSRDEIGFVNSDLVTSFYVSQTATGSRWQIMADGIFLAEYEAKETAKDELRKLQSAMESGQKSYCLN